MGVSENSGTPKSSILTVFSIINHPFWGTPIFGNTHIFVLFFHSPHVEVLKCWKWILKHSRSPHRVPHLTIVLNTIHRQQDSVWSLRYGFPRILPPIFFEKLGTKICQDLNLEIWDTCYLDDFFEGLKNKNKPWVQSNIFRWNRFFPAFWNPDGSFWVPKNLLVVMEWKNPISVIPSPSSIYEQWT